MAYETLNIASGNTVLSISSPDKDGDFEMSIDHRDSQGAHYQYLTKDRARQLIGFLQKHLEDEAK